MLGKLVPLLDINLSLIRPRLWDTRSGDVWWHDFVVECGIVSIMSWRYWHVSTALGRHGRLEMPDSWYAVKPKRVRPAEPCLG